MTFDSSILKHVNPSGLSYQEWLSVGMALKHEGATAHQWEEWSKSDSRYVAGECYRKWDGFRGNSATPVTGGTIVEFAKRQGWIPPAKENRAFEWDDVISGDLKVIDTAWIEDVDVVAPSDNWAPVEEIIKYINTLFESSEYVGYVTEAWKREGEDKWLPKKGSYSRTAGELVQELSKCNGDIGAVFGDYNQEAGAWIRFNPLDGQGVRDSNVTAFRFALIECDNETLERQAAIYKELELPIAAIASSGNKSLHAIVRIEASNQAEYRERVNFLHEVCLKNRLQIDGANKNPSRLSRLPGVMRNGQKQYLVATNQGQPSWEAWKKWVEDANDNLPVIENLEDIFKDLPPLANPLIDGILREGHKLLLAGPSKAGKSFVLLELVMSIAEGLPWLGWNCAQGKVLYVNLELDRASCLHRLKSLYQSLGWQPKNVSNIDIWNLRGKAVPMDALAPKLIRRALQKRYKAVIIDPIYKVITGDENAADKMAHFCNQFDRVCTELGCAVIYCHHHSKGTQGQKSSIDRSSGSGVFARDPDAIIDLIELQIDDNRRKQIRNREVCNALKTAMDVTGQNWQASIGQDDLLVDSAMVEISDKILGPDKTTAICKEVNEATKNISGWRMEGTLREFAPFDAKRFFFRYPVHVADTDGILKDAVADGERPERREKKKPEEVKKQKNESLETAYNAVSSFGEDTVTTEELAEYMGLSKATVEKQFRAHPGFVVSKGGILPKHLADEFEIDSAFKRIQKLNETVTLQDLAKEMNTSEKTVRRKAENSKNVVIESGVISWIGN